MSPVNKDSSSFHSQQHVCCGLYLSLVTPGLAEASFCILVLASELLNTSISICLPFYNARTVITGLYSCRVFSTIPIINCSHQIPLIQLLKVPFVSCMDLTNVLSQGSLKSMLEETVPQRWNLWQKPQEVTSYLHLNQDTSVSLLQAVTFSHQPLHTSEEGTLPSPPPPIPVTLSFRSFRDCLNYPINALAYMHILYTPQGHKPSREVALFLPFPVIN